MDIKITHTIDITDRLEAAILTISKALKSAARAGVADNRTAVEPEEAPATAEIAEVIEEPAPAVEAPKKAPRKSKKAPVPAAEISNPAQAVAGAEQEQTAEPQAEQEQDKADATAAETDAKADDEKKSDETEKPAEPAGNVDAEPGDETGKGATGQEIAELTEKFIKRINDENRDRPTLNRNLRAACERCGVQFPTVPALIQAIGYGNAYRACIGEG